MITSASVRTTVPFVVGVRCVRVPEFGEQPTVTEARIIWRKERIASSGD
jgi:hypothetical protein